MKIKPILTQQDIKRILKKYKKTCKKCLTIYSNYATI